RETARMRRRRRAIGIAGALNETDDRERWTSGAEAALGQFGKTMHRPPAASNLLQRLLARSCVLSVTRIRYQVADPRPAPRLFNTNGSRSPRMVGKPRCSFRYSSRARTSDQSPANCRPQGPQAALRETWADGTATRARSLDRAMSLAIALQGITGSGRLLSTMSCCDHSSAQCPVTILT